MLEYTIYCGCYTPVHKSAEQRLCVKEICELFNDIKEGVGLRMYASIRDEPLPYTDCEFLFEM